MKLSAVREVLTSDTLSRKGDVYTARWGFYYTMGRKIEMYEERVRKSYPGAEIIESGEVWKSFRGGAPVGQQSHFFVKFRIPEKVENPV